MENTLILDHMLPRPALVRTPTPDVELGIFPPPPPLERQTNIHELLPHDLREKWWSATTPVEKDDIMMQYEALFW
jgi:hypothetical protein